MATVSSSKLLEFTVDYTDGAYSTEGYSFSMPNPIDDFATAGLSMVETLEAAMIRDGIFGENVTGFSKVAVVDRQTTYYVNRGAEDPEGGGKTAATLSISPETISASSAVANYIPNGATLASVSYNGDGTLYATPSYDWLSAGFRNGKLFLCTADNNLQASQVAGSVVNIFASETANYESAAATFTIV